jgi:hypothetical protein
MGTARHPFARPHAIVLAAGAKPARQVTTRDRAANKKPGIAVRCRAFVLNDRHAIS